MSYLVMESRIGYAIVLDESGRFKKVVNKGYDIGQFVDEIICFEEADNNRDRRRWTYQITSLAAAACLCLVLAGAYRDYMTLFGTVRIQINPDIMLSVNENDYVIGMEGMNKDGEVLLEDYKYRFKKVETVSNELADKAIEEGCLGEGGIITIEVESSHSDWKEETENKVITNLKEHITIDVDIHSPEEKRVKEKTSITIEIPEEKVVDSSNYESNYADEDSNISDYSNSNFEASDYGSSDSHVRDYSDSNFENSDYD